MANPRGTTFLVLALGPEVISLLQAVPTPEGARVNGRWEVDTPAGILNGGAVQDAVRLSPVLRALWRKSGVRERSVAVVIPSAGYSMRNLRLPDLPEAERRRVVRGELEQNGAIPFGGGSFDFIWKGAGQGESAEVYAYFVADASVQPLREALDEAGLVLQRLEPSSLATIRAYLSTLSRPQPVAVLCPTERYTDLCIHDGRNVQLLRRIPAGYEDLLHDTQQGGAGAHGGHAFIGGAEEESSARRQAAAPVPLAVWDDAEGVSGFAVSSPPPETSAAPAPGAASELAASPRQRSVLEEEVARSLAFYAREYQDLPFPTTLVVVGRGELLPRFEQLLTNSVPLPVVGLDLLQELPMPAPQVEAAAAADPGLLLAAVGAAIGSSTHTLGVPALHVGQQERRGGLKARERRRLVYVGLGGAALFLAVAATGAGVLTILEMDQRGNHTQLTSQIQQVQAARAPVLRYHEVSNAARQLRDATQIPVGSVLGRVAAATNPGISIRTLGLTADGKLSVDGRAATTASLERFGRDLAVGNTVRLPIIESLQRSKEGALDFRITALSGKVPVPGAPAAGEGL